MPVELWSRTGLKLALRLATYLVSSNEKSGETILADLVRVAPMATERGRNALINTAADKADIIEALSKLGNDSERALWMLMTHSDLFRD